MAAKVIGHYLIFLQNNMNAFLAYNLKDKCHGQSIKPNKTIKEKVEVRCTDYSAAEREDIAGLITNALVKEDMQQAVQELRKLSKEKLGIYDRLCDDGEELVEKMAGGRLTSAIITKKDGSKVDVAVEQPTYYAQLKDIAYKSSKLQRKFRMAVQEAANADIAPEVRTESIELLEDFAREGVFDKKLLDEIKQEAQKGKKDNVSGYNELSPADLISPQLQKQILATLTIPPQNTALSDNESGKQSSLLIRRVFNIS